MAVTYNIYGNWGARPETPRALAERLSRTIDRLQTIDPAFNRWLWLPTNIDYEDEAVPVSMPFTEVSKYLEGAIAENVSRDQEDHIEPDWGYGLIVVNEEDSGPRGVGLSVSAGKEISFDFGFSNKVELGLGGTVQVDPALVIYAIVREALLIIAETWEVTCCQAYPSDITDHWSGQKLRLAWMTYISPHFAPLIVPPPTAIVERRPNGGLFMAATDETFTTANPKHMAVARHIEAALEPLIALPFPIDAPYR